MGLLSFPKKIDKEKTVFLDVLRKIPLDDFLSWEIKVGGKYRTKYRFKRSSELPAYYLYGYHNYNINDDGTVVTKDFSGTRFENLYLENNNIISSNFLNTPPDNRNIFDLYYLNPMVNKNALREWYELIKMVQLMQMGVAQSIQLIRKYVLIIMTLMKV